MRFLTLLATSAAAFALAVPASAQFTVSGGGGPLNAMGAGGTGGGGNASDTLPDSWSEYPATSAVPMNAPPISSVTLTDLNHTWAGDLQIVLVDPNGVGYNLLVRLNVAAGASCCGHSADFGGDYTFLPAGDPGIDQIWPDVNPGATAILPTGSYAQNYGTLNGNTGWVDGSDNTFNFDLAQIPVVAGIWTLFVYDGAGGDTGDLFGGWSMSGGFGSGPGTNYCTAEMNSTGAAAAMTAVGSTSIANNNIVVTAESLPNQAFGYFLTSTTQDFIPNPGGSMGNLCLGGAIGRYVGPGQIQNSANTGAISLPID
ncbi:MAG: hypothetical protein AAGB93_21370, partial [Planctomycetota bacterium]